MKKIAAAWRHGLKVVGFAVLVLTVITGCAGGFLVVTELFIAYNGPKVSERQKEERVLVFAERGMPELIP